MQLVNLKTRKGSTKDGDEVSVIPKDLGHSEIYAQNILFSPTGRYFTLCSDQDYVVYSTHKFVNSGFGTAANFVWGSSNDYAVRTKEGTIKIFKNFNEDKTYKTDYTNEDLYGGKLIGISGGDFVSFYDWDNFSLVRKIDTTPP